MPYFIRHKFASQSILSLDMRFLSADVDSRLAAFIGSLANVQTITLDINEGYCQKALNALAEACGKLLHLTNLKLRMGDYTERKDWNENPPIWPLATLCPPQLVELSLFDAHKCDFSGVSQRLTHLTSLSMYDYQFQPNDLAEIASLPSLSVLSLEKARFSASASLQQLMPSTSLCELKLNDVSPLPDECAPALAKFCTEYTSAHVSCLVHLMPRLVHLTLAVCFELTSGERVARDIGKLPCLETLFLDSCTLFTFKGIEESRSLREFQYRGTVVYTQDTACVAKIPSLTKVTFEVLPVSVLSELFEYATNLEHIRINNLVGGIPRRIREAREGKEEKQEGGGEKGRRGGGKGRRGGKEGEKGEKEEEEDPKLDFSLAHRLKNLKHFEIWYSRERITNEHIAHLARVPSLESLEIKGCTQCDITASGLTPLSSLRSLHTLWLPSVQNLLPSALPHLCAIENLRTLTIARHRGGVELAEREWSYGDEGDLPEEDFQRVLSDDEERALERALPRVHVRRVRDFDEKTRD